MYCWRRQINWSIDEEESDEAPTNVWVMGDRGGGEERGEDGSKF